MPTATITAPATTTTASRARCSTCSTTRRSHGSSPTSPMRWRGCRSSSSSVSWAISRRCIPTMRRGFGPHSQRRRSSRMRRSPVVHPPAGQGRLSGRPFFLSAGLLRWIALSVAGVPLAFVSSVPAEARSSTVGWCSVSAGNSAASPERNTGAGAFEMRCAPIFLRAHPARILPGADSTHAI
jgi:hypothetical protein